MADEFETMRILEKAVLDLDEDKRPRVVQWFFSRFADGAGIVGLGSSRANASAQLATVGAYENFADLFDAANPTIEREKALVAAYWIQICKGQPSFASQPLNDELKNLGHGIGNITEALNQLREERPALVLQLKKSGLTKQARKTYKLTQEGVKKVQSLFNGNREEDEV